MQTLSHRQYRKHSLRSIRRGTRLRCTRRTGALKKPLRLNTKHSSAWCNAAFCVCFTWDYTTNTRGSWSSSKLSQLRMSFFFTWTRWSYAVVTTITCMLHLCWSARLRRSWRLAVIRTLCLEIPATAKAASWKYRLLVQTLPQRNVG